MRIRIVSMAFLLAFMVAALGAQNSKTATPGIISGSELQQLVPQSYFFAGKTAPTQLRNSSAVRSKSGKVLLAGMVDVSGYSSGVAEKYQGFLITEAPVKIGGQELKPGAYGFGTSSDGNFVVSDIAANQLFSTALQADAQMKRAMPLKITADGDNYRLYLGKKYVEVSFE